MTIQKIEGPYTSGSTAATGRLVDMHAVQHGYSILCLVADNASSMLRKTGQEVSRQRWTSGTSLVKRQLHGRRKAAKKFNEFVVTATDDLEQCHEQPSLFRRPGTSLIFECHQDDFYVSGSNVELPWLQENLGARLKLKPAEPMGPGSQKSYFRATRTREDADTIRIAPRENYIKNVLGIFILGLGDNKCKSMPTPIVQTRQKSDEDEPRLGEEDRRAYNRCAGILRLLLRHRPYISFLQSTT